MYYPDSSFSSKLKGYAIKEDFLLGGYFRFHKERLQCFDGESNRVLLHLNARYQGDIHRLLVGFTYNLKEQSFHTGLEKIIQTVDVYGHGEETHIKKDSLRPAQEKFLYYVLQRLEGIAPAVCHSSLPIRTDRCPNELKNGLIGFPDEFRDNFFQAAHQGNAYSLKPLSLFFSLKELGFRASPDRIYSLTSSPESFSSGRRTHARRSHGQ